MKRAAIAVISIGLLGAVAAQSGSTTVWDGVFTEDQAARGRTTYEQACAACHLDDLLGDGDAPALTGTAFEYRWNTLSVGDMLAMIRATMPPAAPASLNTQAYADIVSYILHSNGLPGGRRELPPDEELLNEIIVLTEWP